jgi:hypothetical protein
MHGDLEVDREVAHALALVILAGLPEVGAGENGSDGRVRYQIRTSEHGIGPTLLSTRPIPLVAGVGLEPTTSGYESARSRLTPSHPYRLCPC